MKRADVTSPVSRRVVLCGTGCAAGLAVLSACGAGGSQDTKATDEPTQPEPGAPLADAADVPVGGAISAKDSSGKPLIIAQPAQGDFVAYSAICTHTGCTVAPDTDELKCPCHGSTYDLATGKNTGGPAPSPLAKFDVAVQDGKIMAT